MRVLRRISVVTLITVVASLFGAAAFAQSPSKTGWWNAATANGVALPQPTTGPEDLHVGQGPNGPAAYAAVAYDLPGVRVSSAVFELKVVANSTVGTIDVLACPTKTVVWKGGGNQSYDARPAVDCTKGVRARVSPDGLKVTFLLDTAQQLAAGGFSLAIVPAVDALPFAVDFAKPDANTLTPQVSALPLSSPTPAPALTPSPATQLGGPLPTAPDAFGVPVLPPPDAFAPVTAPVPALVGPLPPALAAPPTTALNPVLVRAPVLPTGQRARLQAGVLLALVVGGFGWALLQPTRAPRRIGGAARTGRSGDAALAAEGPVRGIGRFAVARTAPPRRLI